MTDADLTYVPLDKSWVESNWCVLESLCNVPMMRWDSSNYLADLPGKWEVSHLVLIGGKAAGYFIGSFFGRYLWIHRLVVSEARRDQAIGSQLLTYCRDVALSHGLRGVLLKTPVTNEGAIRFYDREGFVRLADFKDHCVFRRDYKSGFKVGVHQPNYLPWLGYFYKIFLSDTFVFLDDVPVPKGSYTVRTKVLINGEAKWLTVPSSRGLSDEVKDSFPAGRDWVSKHLKTLEGSYARAPHFKEYFPDLAGIIEAHRESSLADLNIALIQKILGILGIRRLLYRSAPFALTSSADERLVEIVKLMKGDEYISGSGGANYQSEETFSRNSIKLEYSNFKPAEYSQRSSQFVPGLSVLDALFNTGADGILDIFLSQAKTKAAE